MRISVAVQHHPRRANLLPPLLELLWPLDVEVVTDPGHDDPFPSPWRCYRHALETTPEWATHRLVIQDDAEPCEHFERAASAAIAARSDRPVVFCVCGDPSSSAIRMRSAVQRGRRWAELDVGPGSFIPAIAVAWPVETIARILEFADEQEWNPRDRCDDQNLALAVDALGIVPVATVPSLVEHPDLVESLMSSKRARGGQDPGRVALFPLPPGADAREIDWLDA